MSKNSQTKKSLWQKLRSYGLHHSIYILIILFIAALVTTAGFYFLYISGDQGFLFNLMVALSTSLLASVFCMISDLFLKYRECENDELLKGLYEFGISSLHFDKKILLEQMIRQSNRECWLSGYRLIVTRSLLPCLKNAIQNDVHLRFLLCPPWSEAYKLTHGSNDHTIDNYFHVFEGILHGAGSPESAQRICQVKFTNKPLFNDTYKVDKYLITGSYLHNRDRVHGRVTASDFFCFDLERESELYNLINDEYLTLWEESASALDWHAFSQALAQYKASDLLESEKLELLMNACRKPTIE